jgi:glycosyltransferase involved in cell wall biosynthesis
VYDTQTLNSATRGAGAVSPAEEPLSLAFYSPSWPAGHDSNGIVTYVGTIVPELQARGHVTSVVTATVAGSPITDGVYGLDGSSVYRTLPSRLLNSVMFRVSSRRAQERAFCRSIVAATQRAITERGIQLLEMEETWGWSYRVQRKISIPVIVRLHGPWFLTGPANGYPIDASLRARARKEGRALCAADGVTAPSLDVLERTRSYYGLALERAEVIPNPVPDAPAWSHWNPTECKPYEILFIGRFDLNKGGDIVIDAFRRVVERIPQARLRFVGLDRGIPRSDGRKWTIRDYTDEQIPGAWQSGRIEWLDRQPHTALAGFRRQAAVTVVCSRYETFGLTATEAMSQGCPLVVTAAGALSEIVQDGVNGLVCRPDDPGDLAEKLCFLLEQPPVAERLGRQAAIDSRQRYNPDLLAARSVDYYQHVIARARTKRGISLAL